VPLRRVRPGTLAPRTPSWAGYALRYARAVGTGTRPRGAGFWPGGAAVFMAVAIGALGFAARARADTISVIPASPAAVEGQTYSGAVAQFLDTDGDPASAFAITVAWGDGSTSPGTAANDLNGLWDVTATHTYAEEGVYTATVTVDDEASGTVRSAQETVSVTDAALTAPTGGSVSFSGAGAAAAGAMSAFTAAIGGADNGTYPGGAGAGYRHLDWDSVAMDGSTPGSRVISPGHVVSIAPWTTQPYGLELSRPVAVSDDGFTAVDPGAAGLFAPFSGPNLMAPFDGQSLRIAVISPTGMAASPVYEATRGLGAIFLDVSEPGSGLDFYDGSTLIGHVDAPPAGPGQASFAGMLFGSAVVTSVVVDLGTAPVFDYDGASATPGPPNAPPDGANLVALDDVVLAEPASPGAGAQATAGVQFAGQVAGFTDQDPGGVPTDYAATIDWGDGSRSSGTVTAAGGGYSVSGTHTFARAGTFQVQTTVTDIGGASQVLRSTISVSARPTRTRVACSPRPVMVAMPASCTVTVSDVGGGSATPPTGTVSLATRTAGLGFAVASCPLRASGAASARCSVTLAAADYPPRRGEILASYAGDTAHAASHASLRLSLAPAGCLVSEPAVRLAPPAQLRVSLACVHPSLATVSATALIGAGRHARHLALGRRRVALAGGATRTVLLAVARPLARLLLAAERARGRIAIRVGVLAPRRSATYRVTVTEPLLQAHHPRGGRRRRP